MNRSARALTLLTLWIATLALLGWYVQRQLVLGADLRLFLPSPATAEQRLLIEEIGEGPASRVLTVAIAGAPVERLAEASRELAAALRESSEFRFVANGEMSLDALPESLLAYRYLLSPTLDAHALDVGRLKTQIEARSRDLASPAGAFIEPLLARDPTLELLNVLERWRPMSEPRREFDVWFDARGDRALLLAETQAAAFDPERQRVAIDILTRQFARLNADGVLQLTVSGPGKFSVMMEERTRTDAQRLGALATLGMIVLIVFAYRSAGAVILSALPLASAALAGLALVSALFGEVHGITLAFGFTLIGVAQDYPIHLLSHAGAERTPVEVARKLWPTLATGVASTCIAYLTFLFSGVVGLQQLACFTVAGLAVAGLTTRFALPALMSSAVVSDESHVSDSTLIDRTQRIFERAPHSMWIAAALCVLCGAALVLKAQTLWENDLSRLTPVPENLLKQDQEMRAELGAPDVSYLLIVQARNEQAAIERLESLDSKLADLVGQRAISGYDHAARYIPSAQTQLARQARLPDAATLRASLEAATADSAFRTDAFEPFLQDVASARTLSPLTTTQLRDTPLAPSLDMLLRVSDAQTTAIVTFAGVADVDALQRMAKSAGPDATLLNLKSASESLVAEQRERILWSLALAAVLLTVVVWLALRDAQRVVRVLAPMTLTTLVIIATLQTMGVSLTLFHLISLILAAGLGLDYALFFEHSAHDPKEQRRTTHAILVCSLSTLMVFALLATSSLPVLRAIGVTVSLGVISNFVLALVMTRATGTGLWALGSGQRGKEGASSLSGQSPEPSTQSPSFPLSQLIPHQGSMCLLERIVEWNDERVVLESDTHRSLSNPLRQDGRLRAIHLCEYGAQAMAVHGALRAGVAGSRPTPGMLASLRNVTFKRDYIEDLPGALRVEAHCLQANESSLQYAFRITHEGELLAEGRAAVVLGKTD